MRRKLLEEAERTRQYLSKSSTAEPRLRNLVSDAILAQVLFALWDKGFYDYVIENETFSSADAARELGFEMVIFQPCINFLCGRDVLEHKDGIYRLTEKGRDLHIVLSRGLHDLFLGGYGAMLRELPQLLTGEVAIDDPKVVRSGRHTAVGTEESTCVYLMPRVLKTLADKGYRNLLDLGCGAGGFLIQACQLYPELRGVGVDINPDAIEQAKKNAQSMGVADRLSFRLGDVRLGEIPAEEIKEVELVTAMFILHEFGRAGDEGIVSSFKMLHKQFPGRTLLFLENEPPSFDEPPVHPSILDYYLVHPLSGQGEPKTHDEWLRLLGLAGLKLKESELLPSKYTRTYFVELS